MDYSNYVITLVKIRDAIPITYEHRRNAVNNAIALLRAVGWREEDSTYPGELMDAARSRAERVCRAVNTLSGSSFSDAAWSEFVETLNEAR